MADAHDADGILAQGAVDDLHERAEYVLGHCRGVASRSVGHRDAGLGTPAAVDMVGADGGGAHKSHSRAFEQGAVAAGAGAHDDGVGAAYCIGVDGLGGHVAHAGVRLEYPQIGYIFFDDDIELFHPSISRHIARATYMPATASTAMYWRS